MVRILWGDSLESEKLRRTSSRAFQNPHLWSLLGAVRFLLAAIVWSFHSDIATLNHDSYFNYLGRFRTMPALIGFFVISGFSIAHSISQRPEGFYLRRVARIYPVYFVCSIIAGALYFVPGARDVFMQTTVAAPTLLMAAGNVLLLQTYLTTPILGPSWSLAVEVGYYVLAPIFMRLKRDWLYVIALLSAASFLYGNTIGWGEYVYPNATGLKFCVFAWAWLSGFLFYLEKRSLRSLLLLAAGFPLVMLYNALLPALATYFVVFITLRYGEHIYLSERMSALFEYLGNLSYPLYLCHICVFVALRGIFNITNGFAHLFVSLVASALLYHLVDRPVRKFIAGINSQWIKGKAFP